MTPGRLRAILSYWHRRQNDSVETEIAHKHINELANVIAKLDLTDDTPESKPDFIRTSPPFVSVGQGEYRRDFHPEDIQ